MFSGLLVCADCGSNLNHHFNQKNHEIKYFNCQNYIGNRGTCKSTHYIRADFLEKVVLGEIRRLTRFASQYEEVFIQSVMGKSRKAIDHEQSYRKKELATLLTRDNELDVLFEHLYEDSVTGKISDERFHRMSCRYEEEQAELKVKANALQKEVEQSENNEVSADMFVSTVRKYTRAKKLTPRMLNELVHHIEVYHAEKVGKVHVQKLIIHYNCVGTIDVPDIPCLAPQKVQIQTRKGVAVSNVTG